jgi:hypothetical protein
VTEKARAVEVEVLPPERKEPEPVARLIALLMDNAFRIPGTNFRFGLDPLIGLFPGFGDTIAGVISAVVIAQSARLGLPRIVMARMALNILINAVVGAVPVAGDAFSFWFKSNARNYALLTKHAGSRASTRADWFFVCGLLAGVLIVLALLIFGLAALIASHLNRW